MKILLVEAPWGASLRPAMGLHVLKTWLDVKHPELFQTEILYSNIDFYDDLPECFDKDILHAIFWSNPEISWFGEAFFAPYAYPDATLRATMHKDFNLKLKQISRDPNSERLVPEPMRNLLQNHLPEVLYVFNDLIPSFLEGFSNLAIVQKANVIGFGFHFNQLFAALSMARSLKNKSPESQIALGGASMTEPLAQLIPYHFPQIDQLFTGESESNFANYCLSLIEEAALVNGFPARHPNQKAQVNMVDRHVQTPINVTTKLDYSTFFRRIENSRFRSQLRSAPIEFTRDCYWARKSQCSFCGLPQYRSSRSAYPDEVMMQIDHLIKKEKVNHFIFTDPAIYPKKAEKLLDSLANHFSPEEEQPIFFFELRPDTSKEDLRKFAALSNAVIQIGIESFSTSLLNLMKKGVDAITNVQFLKWCRELGVFPYYNILYRHPGEDPKAYEEMLDIIPNLIHLNPPSGYTPILLCRDSPLFEQGSEYIKKAIPWLEYRYLFPHFNEQELMDAAYYFDFEGYDADGNPLGEQPVFEDMVRKWQEWGEFGAVHLIHFYEGDQLIITDNRPVFLKEGKERIFEIDDPLRIAVIEALDSIKDISGLKEAVADHDLVVDEIEIKKWLAFLLKEGLAIEENGRFIGLSVKIN